MTQGLSLRPAGPADAEALALLGAATMLETYADLVDGPDIVLHCQTRHAPAVYAAWLADPEVTIWLAETARGNAIGYLVLTPATLPEAAHPGDLEVQRIYVLSRFHGDGIGYDLMSRALQAGRARGATQIVLGVLQRNTRAVDFYRRQGFVQVGARHFQVGASICEDFVLARGV